MHALSTIRHQEIFHAPKFIDTPIHIIGAGATGSRVFMSLLELGLTHIHVYDDDFVEEHNLANQAYNHAHVGLPKVQSLAQLAAAKYGAADTTQLPDTMTFRCVRVEKNSLLTFPGIVFLLVDTMAARKEIVHDVLIPAGVTELVIETRMASSYGNVLQFPPTAPSLVEAWTNTLVSDDDAEVSACGASISVGPTAAILANMAVWQLIHYFNDDGATDDIVDFFLKPAVLSTKRYS